MGILFLETTCLILLISVPEIFVISTEPLPANRESKTKVELLPSLKAPQSMCKAQAGQVGYLTCTTSMPTNLSLAWIRLRDNHILTVDTETFIQDNRLVHRSRLIIRSKEALSLYHFFLLKTSTSSCQQLKEE